MYPEGSVMEGILVTTAARPESIHFDSFWGLPGFQNGHDHEKSSSKGTAVGGDFFESVQEADLYRLEYILKTG
jgi:hypothetical protein